MSTRTDISALYIEFTGSLTEVLAENAVGPARRGRFWSVEAAFEISGSHAKRRLLTAPCRLSPSCRWQGENLTRNERGYVYLFPCPHT